MNFYYNNPFEESKIKLTDLVFDNGFDPLKESGLYKIVWSMSDLKITIDGCNIELKKNQVLFCTPLNILQIPERSKETYALMFNREFYCIRDHDEEVSCNGLLFYGSSRPVILDLDIQEKSTFEDVFMILKEEFNFKDNSQGEMLRVMLKRLIVKSTRFLKTKMSILNFSTDRIDLVRKFNILVEKNFRNHHKVTDYAVFLYKSPKTVANIFAKLNGKTPLEIINERILLEAKRLLMFSEKSIQEIAYEIGYEDAGYFSKFFKKHSSFTPAEFRKKMQESQIGNILPS